MKRGMIVIESFLILIVAGLLPILLAAIPGMKVEWWISGIYWLISIPTVAFLLVYFLLAPNNCFFTFVKEGTAKFVVRGDKFEKCLIQWEGYTFDYSKHHPEKWNVIPGKERHIFGGLRFYGVWPLFDIHVYKFRWTGVTEDGKIQHKEEWLDYILLKDDVYWCKVEQCEDTNLLPLDLELLLTIAVVNPYKAHFAVQNWLETVINRMKPFIRGYITQKAYEDWIKMRGSLGEELKIALDFAGLLKELEEWYGVKVKKVEVKEINPPKEYREKTIAPYLAELDKRAMILRAEGEKQAIITKAEGEQQRIEKVFAEIQKFGDLGKLIRALEAMEKSPLAASVAVQAIPGLPELLRGVFGRPPAEVTAEEIRRLRETIEKLEELLKKQK
jgi:ribosomal protein L23